MAPVMKEVSVEDPETGIDDAIQETVDQILLKALLNDTANIKAIQQRFPPGDVRICVRFTYIITCPGNECQNTTASFNCSADYNSTYTWSRTSFNPFIFEGQFLYFYASQNYEVFGLDWGGACDLSDAKTPILKLNTDLLDTTLCGVDKAKEYIEESLKWLTKMVSIYPLY